MSARNPRRGLQRLECECGAIAYATWAQCESRPLPVCGQCAAPYVPTDPDLAALVCSPEALAAHPWVAEYERQTASVEHGQAGPARSLRSTGKVFRPAEEIAWERVRSAMREAAREAQLAPLRRPVEPLPF